MRIRVSHRSHYSYKKPARGIIQILRLTPRSHDGQRVGFWRIDTDVDHALKAGEDSYGNITHTLGVAGPLTELTVTVEGEIETFDTVGVLRGASERFPPHFYLRTTPLTEADNDMRAFAEEKTAGAKDRVAALHALMGALHEAIVFDAEPTTATTSAAVAFGLKRGVCQDFAHLFIGCARHLGIPARYISGHYLHVEGPANQSAGHAWAEAYVEGLGWVGFDPAHDLCPQECHVSIARGLDYLSAAPVRGSRIGGEGETLDVEVRVSSSTQVQGQSQRQG
jgi:transglutaminase-like putative cysteine protease